MLWTCIVAVILGAGGESSTTRTEVPAPTTAPASDTTVVFQADFERDSDLNFDGWPDGWLRERGPGYPPFAKVEIVKAAGTPCGKQALLLSLDGGAIQVSSPNISMHGQFSYAASIWLRAEGLVRSAARLTLKVTTAEGLPCGELQSPWQRETNGWLQIDLGPMTPTANGKLQGILILEVAPQVEPGDLQGKVWIDGVQVTRLPRMALSMNSEHHILTLPSRPRLQCQASGIQQANPQVEFVLFDAGGKTLAKQTVDFSTSNKGHLGEDSPGFVGTAAWEPPVDQVGFYRVRGTMLGGAEGSWLTRETTFALVHPLDMPEAGEFGWSLPLGEKPLAVGPLSQVVLHSGLHHVRFPVWFNLENQAAGDRVAWFAERLSMHHVELIGVLDQPPAELRSIFRDKGELPAASVFVDPQLWGPAVDQVMMRLSLKVRRWQLGSDRDLSFVGYPQLASKITEIRSSLNRMGQNLSVVLNWSWLQEEPEPAEEGTPWDALTYSANPALTAAELRAYLSGPKSELQGERWVELEPLPASSFSLAARVRDLVERMIAAKQGGANVIFASQPFDEEQGLMNSDGTVGELFLPWRTTAEQLSGREYVGEFQLPNGSTNFVFAQNGKAVLVVWSDHPTQETFYAEPGTKIIDVWGRERELVQSEAANHQVQVGPWPIFVIGLNEHLARWRIAANFRSRRLESMFGREQKLVLQIKNPFPQAVAGEVTILAPETWDYPKLPIRFRAGEGEELELPIPVQLSLDASGGAHSVRLDFDLHANEHYKFSLFRPVYIGLEDITLETHTRLLEDGSLQLDLNIHNQSALPVSFNMVLFPPGRRRETKQLVNLPPGRNSAKIILADGADLIGQRIYLRAEELGGVRVFNQSVIAER